MKHRLLFIDDNPMMGAFLSQLFGKEYDVMWCSTAEEALSWLQNNHHPELIIVDFEMDGLNGLEFLQRVKSSGMFHTIPVVMLSGTKTSQNRIACLKEGAEDFIVKPFNPTELTIKVANLIKRNSLQSA